METPANAPPTPPRKLRFFRWQTGREKGGYTIFPMLYWGHSRYFGVDSYLLHYAPGTSIPPHLDALNSFSGCRHFRVNITLWHTGRGGEFKTEQPFFRFGPVVIFRPDINRHWVTTVEGRRLLLSIGFKL